MKASTILSTLTFAITAHSAAVCIGTSDNYDDITVSPAAQFLPILGTQVGTYHGLNYSDFVVANLRNQVVGLQPESGTNVAATSMLTNLLSSFSLTLYPFGSIKAAGGTTQSFNLQNFYFGCVIDLHNGIADPAISCPVTICGRRADGSTVPCETFQFNAPSNSAFTKVPLQLATPSLNYQGVQEVVFGVGQTAGGALTSSQVGLALDNICHFNNII